MIGFAGIIKAIPTIINIAGVAKQALPVIYKAKDLVEDATTSFTSLLDRKDIKEDAEVTLEEASLIESEDVSEGLRKTLTETLPSALLENINDGSKNVYEVAIKCSCWARQFAIMCDVIALNAQKIDENIPD